MKKFVIFDLEATCYDNRTDEKKPDDFVNEIIEIGAVKLDVTGKEIDRFSKFAQPTSFPTLSKFCTELTTITQEDIDGADNLKFILQEFMNWCHNCTLISWGHYDKKQLSNDLLSNGLKYYLDHLDDHHSLKHLHAKWNNLKQKSGIGMSKALQMEGFKLDGTHHRGIDDAINITKIFKKYIHKF
jgi:inhibitor of KinA sporulation pathway (predicted exonuclease)